MMKRAGKIGAVVVGVVVMLATGFVGWVQLTWSADHPDTPLPALAATDDPAVVARGEYMVHAVAHCSTCHMPAENFESLDLDTSAPLVGGHVFEMGPFGSFTAANLTPHETGIASFSDGELARVIRHGIGRTGKLSPMMRFAVSPMADEDIVAIMSYLRAQEPVAGERAAPVFGFLAKALSGKFKPRLDEAPPFVAEGGISVERGRYLANGPAVCSACHTPLDPMAGFAPAGEPFSGGARPEPDPTAKGFEIVAPNLTPHDGTGHIAHWSEDQFVARFAAGRVVRGSAMPWEAFQLMTEDDVRSIYRYLRTLPPVERNTGPTHRKKG